MDPNTRSLIMGASGGAAEKIYVEDVFSTWLYTGNGSTQTITNGIDLSGKGGLVWTKSRNVANAHTIHDSARTLTSALLPNATNAEADQGTTGVTAFNSSGYAIGSGGRYNTSAEPYVSWTFRKQAKFFDVVTYTGNGTNNDIAHSLGVAPGFILIKRTDSISDWFAYPRYDDSGNATFPYLYKDLKLNTTDASAGNLGSLASSTILRANSTGGNINGATYVAYLFAHDAGGFGNSGNGSVVKCGSYTGNGSTTGPVVDLGWEPQWLLVKSASGGTGNWWMLDNMRGLVSGTGDNELQANTSIAEIGTYNHISPTPTGFALTTAYGELNTLNNTYIYIAIRRGPMKTPTDATKVFGLNARTGTGVNATVTGGQVDDAVLIKNRGSVVGDLFAARLTGTRYLETSSTAAEIAAGTTILQANPWDVMDGVKVGTTSTITNASANTFINYLFRRAPGFFDVVAYTGTGANRTVSHNLGVAPELMIIKTRSNANNWPVYHSALGATKWCFLDDAGTELSTTFAWNSTAPTSTQFTTGTASAVNQSGWTFIAYLFATCPGVSKVGSYTGTSFSTQNIDCGFTAGARFVLIKRTDSTGDWYVWDTARGIGSGNYSPYLLLNSTAAEVTSTDYIRPLNAGFIVWGPSAWNTINVSGATYIYLAIA